MHILFVCIGNTCRSQMAEGFATAAGIEGLTVSGAGTRPLGWVDPQVIELMNQRGIDISAQRSTGFSDDLLKQTDVVITLGCCSADELCPASFTGEKEDWPIEDPYGADIEVYERVADDIQHRVQDLLQRLSV